MTEDYYGVPIIRKAPLSAATEAEMFRQYRKKRTVARRKQIVEQYLYWATEIANRYCGRRFPKPEAISAANLGLMQAIETFDPARGKRFVTFSFFAMRRTIIDAMRTSSFAVNPFPAMKAAHYIYKKSGKLATLKPIDQET